MAFIDNLILRNMFLNSKLVYVLYGLLNNCKNVSSAAADWNTPSQTVLHVNKRA